MKSFDRLTGVLIFSIIIGILAIALSNAYISSTLQKEVVEGIGIGLLVAGIVGITVENYSKSQMQKETDRMLREIRTNVFRASLGTQFPEPLWIQIWNHILLRSVVRKKISLDVSLDLLEGYTEFVKVHTCWSYTLCSLNPTSGQEYPMVATLDRPFHKQLSAQTEFTAVTVNGEVILPKCNVSKTSAEVICQAPIELGPNEEKQVVIRGVTILRLDQVVPHSMVDPSIDLEISVSKPEAIEVVLDPIHPREDRLTEVHTALESNRKCWRIIGGILPGHGVTLRWYPHAMVADETTLP